jgi:hypothetical protein
MGQGQVSVSGSRGGLRTAAENLFAQGQADSGLSRSRFNSIMRRAEANTGFSRRKQTRAKGSFGSPD